MSIIFAFISGGIICLLGQMLLLYVKIAPPKILIGSLVLGALLSPFGIMDILNSWGGGGVASMVLGCGQAFFTIFQAALHSQFQISMMIIAIFVFILGMGTITGCLYVKIYNIHPLDIEERKNATM